MFWPEDLLRQGSGFRDTKIRIHYFFNYFRLEYVYYRALMGGLLAPTVVILVQQHWGGPRAGRNSADRSYLSYSTTLHLL